MAYKKTGKTGKDVEEFSVGKYKVELRKPGKNEVFMAFRALWAKPEEMDLLRAGEVIFETCAVGYDEEVVDDLSIYMALCMELAKEYVSASDVEIKKK